MATSLDEAVEQLFVGWTPAPPASDHHQYNTFCDSSAQHNNRNTSTQTQEPTPTTVKSVQMHAKAQAVKPAATQPETDQACADGWGEWASPFNSGSTSPDACSQSPSVSAQDQHAIPAWRTTLLDNVQGQAQEQHVGSDDKLHRLVLQESRLTSISHYQSYVHARAIILQRVRLQPGLVLDVNIASKA